MDRKVTIGRCRIPEFLNARGWDQKYLAERTGISESTISSYCTNTRKKMPLVTAVIIADSLGVEARDLYEGLQVKEE
ncbi:helix-turn-helix transcriptional regulator [Paenibacillus sp. HWE-109]|uniref:helix-turn-helix transcriptional regulator n=1 Tax=Paenibacillus sp. HWE-109 TaxID=1306526 RepID=UPI001EDC941B|nr:helix-turn-helix transcriptional regulator [Paenibacillus sp. HWE-109]UKS30210.1 helix-turn-helix transcriptional regulator [Paenibacillus sp. HWE-109]